MTTKEFRQIIWEYYEEYGREMAWREPDADGVFDPYKVLVSEIMLQQTQVDRVKPKFKAFIQSFPTKEQLAKASFAEVLSLWQGLGYSRRAKYLHEFAKNTQRQDFPDSIDELVQHKGIGPNTAAAVLVYSFNQSHIFVETNVRTAVIYHFFVDEDNVSDAQILEVMRDAVDKEHPREFYWALMDYGSYLKRQGIRNNHQSKSYTKQSKFEGSKRLLRGKVLRELTSQTNLSLAEMNELLPDSRLDEVIRELVKDDLISMQGQQISLS